MKVGDNNKHQGNPENHQGLLWKPIFKQIGKSKRNEQIYIYIYIYIYMHQKLNQEDTNYPNRSITSNEIEATRVS
jgi:hypothetical protein